MVEERTLIPKEQQNLNLNINISILPTVGEMSREVESRWRVEKHLPVDNLKESKKKKKFFI
jgi:hypothetical protein